MMRLELDALAVPLGNSDSLCYGKRQRRRIVYQGVPPVVTRIGFCRNKRKDRGSLRDWYNRLMVDTQRLAGPKRIVSSVLLEALSERVRGNPLETDSQQQQKSVSMGLAINSSETDEQQQKKPLYVRIAEKNIPVNDCTAASLKEKKEHLKDALDQLEQRGTQTNCDTYASLLRRCTDAKALSEGKRLHAHIMRSGYARNRFLGNLLVQMYGSCGSLEYARAVFDKISQPNAFSMSIMIFAYTRNGLLEDARSLFDKMPQRDVVSWTAMITAYAEKGRGQEALELFRRMKLEGVKPNKITFISVLDACASLAALAQCQEIHAAIVNSGLETGVVGSLIDSGIETDVVVGTALVNTYGKCGSPDDARRVFDKISGRNVFSWTAMMAAYAQNGCNKEALDLFGRMNLEGMKPNEVTFISILSACSHAGLLDEGWQYLVSMSRDHGFTPRAVHFVCLIDLIGRAGQLDEAEDLINMSFHQHIVAWRAFLGACKIHGNVEQGTHAAKHVFKLDPNDSAPYVLLSNIYAAAGRKADVTLVRQLMEDRGVKKHPGLSCIEVKMTVHQFVVGDRSHPQKEEIYAELHKLSRQMEDAGYMPDTKSVLHDVEDEEKVHLLCYHSEKLAIAFGLINTPAGAPLRIIKNLRVCSDCHAATKFISKIVSRKIILRDANHFHHFEHGVCSCGDYW